jgi:hypothetical protein
VIELQTLASIVAGAVGGRVMDLPGDPPTVAAVALPDGPIPILVRVQPERTIVALDERSWTIRLAELDAQVRDVAKEAFRWTAQQGDAVAAAEIAVAFLSTLTATLGQRWLVSVPPQSFATDVVLTGPSGGTIYVGPRRAHIDAGQGRQELDCRTRADLQAAREALCPLVRQQQAAHAANVELSARIEALGAELMAQLPPLLPRATAWSFSVRGKTSPSSAVEVLLRCQRPDGHAQRVVLVDRFEGKARVHAGLLAPDGWEALVADPSSLDLPAIAAAITTALETMVVENLQTGRRYRVLEPLQELQPGDVVVYRKRDNQGTEGNYLFARLDGRQFAIPAMIEDPLDSPLGAVHRYLRPAD